MQMIQVLTANGVIYPWTIAFARISILLLCLRIFGVDKRMRYAAWFGIIFQALFYTAVFFVGVAQIVKCYGLAQGASQFCRNVSKPLVTLISSVNVVCDFYVLILPIVRVSKLHLNSHRKVGLTIVFSWGLAYVFCPALLSFLSPSLSLSGSPPTSGLDSNLPTGQQSMRN